MEKIEKIRTSLKEVYDFLYSETMDVQARPNLTETQKARLEARKVQIRKIVYAIVELPSNNEIVAFAFDVIG